MSDQPMHAELVWNSGMQFVARAGDNETKMDGDRRTGCSPMELLLASLAGCMAIDLVNILGKMRAELRSVRARIDGTRAESHPRRFTELNLHYEISGAGIKLSDVERAMMLSRETYCSVYATLDPGIRLNITWNVAE